MTEFTNMTDTAWWHRRCLHSIARQKLCVDCIVTSGMLLAECSASVQASSLNCSGSRLSTQPAKVPDRSRD